MTEQHARDYFTDRSVLLNPYAFFEDIRALPPVHPDEARGLYFVTGHDEALEVLRNAADFSSSITVPGPLVRLPFEPKGDDISAEVDAHWAELAGPDLVVQYDGQRHTAARAFLNRLFVPSRLKANKEFMQDLAARMAAQAVGNGRCEAVREIGVPYVTLVIADLLGVPPADRDTFMKVIEQGPTAGDIQKDGEGQDISSLIFMGQYFAQYLAERRDCPRDDIMSELATSTYADGTTPELIELVKLATFLFAAGQDTSAKLLGNSLKLLAETPDLQVRVRAEPALLGEFVEEMLRLEGSTKATFRLARRTTTVGGVEIPAGARVVILLGAANRDPERWECPAEFRFERPKLAEHLAFGRGPHTCIGAPLARFEVQIMLQELLSRTAAILIDETRHGPAGERRFDYDPSYIIRGLSELHLILEAG
ncbi:cytochrome P450 [Sphingomonas tabacisoli]|uniref:Cytochrome P450 n=1 Tax=Sphingomonas tabacisoli TaxID=2249466 RepID=A0ABW4I722_9SPHN